MRLKNVTSLARIKKTKDGESLFKNRDYISLLFPVVRKTVGSINYSTV